MTSVAGALPVVIATLILIVGVVDDFRTRKFHNWLFLVCSGVALGAVIIAGGIAGVHQGVFGFLAGFVALLPLVLMRILGAGDMKLMAAFGIVAGWTAVVNVAVYSLIWGAVFGLLVIVLKGQLRGTLANMASIATLKERQGVELQLHKIPYTVALLMGWLTQLTLQGGLKGLFS